MTPHPRPTGANHAENARAHETHTQSHSYAFTLMELLVVVTVVAILVGMLIPSLTGRHHGARRIKCVNNLKNVGLAVRIYAVDNNDHFPWEIPDTNGAVNINYLSDPTEYIRILSNELSTPKIVICPQDNRKEATNWIQFSRANISYFVSPDASENLPQSFLAGDRNITNILGTLPPGLRALSTTGPAGWDETVHTNQGNACMVDGSVQQLSNARLRDQLRNTGQTNKSIKLSVP
jgi:prepilin-type N-terminal cleavage/methylation domain-containing protein/prepilin-type processing-associated H-X9-DG protein